MKKKNDAVSKPIRVYILIMFWASIIAGTLMFIRPGILVDRFGTAYGSSYTYPLAATFIIYAFCLASYSRIPIVGVLLYLVTAIASSLWLLNKYDIWLSAKALPIHIVSLAVGYRYIVVNKENAEPNGLT